MLVEDCLSSTEKQNQKQEEAALADKQAEVVAVVEALLKEEAVVEAQ